MQGFDPLVERDRCARRAHRYYTYALLIRVVAIICSVIAVLPDSAVVQGLVPVQSYAVITTLAGLGVAVSVGVLRGTRIIETMNMNNEAVAYINRRRAELITADGLTRKKICGEMEEQLALITSRHHRGVQDGLDNLLGQKQTGN